MDSFAASHTERSWLGRVRPPAGTLAVCIAAGLWFWCGAVGKFYVLLRQGYWFSSITGVLGPVPVLGLCLAELALACLVVAKGPESAPIRRFVTGVFVLLALADMMAVIRGETHCGCFGVVSPPVWLVGAVNLLLAGLLWCSGAARLVRSDGSAYMGRSARGYLVAAMVAVPVALPGFLGQALPELLRRDAIVLEPRDWIGRRFPVVLLTGQGQTEIPAYGVLVLYRSDCARCCRVLRSLPKTSASLVLVDLAYGVGSCPGERLAGLLRARVLPLRRDATFLLDSVPQFVSVENGIVTEVSERPPKGRDSSAFERSIEPKR